MKKYLFTALIWMTMMPQIILASAIDTEEAERIALETAGVSADQVTEMEVSEMLEEASDLFRVEFHTFDGVKYDVLIDAADGTVLEEDTESSEPGFSPGFGELTNETELERDELQIPLSDAAGGMEGESWHTVITKCRQDFIKGTMRYELALQLFDGIRVEHIIYMRNGTIYEADEILEE